MTTRLVNRDATEDTANSSSSTATTATTTTLSNQPQPQAESASAKKSDGSTAQGESTGASSATEMTTTTTQDPIPSTATTSVPMTTTDDNNTTASPSPAAATTTAAQATGTQNQPAAETTTAATANGYTTEAVANTYTAAETATQNNAYPTTDNGVSIISSSATTTIAIQQGSQQTTIVTFTSVSTSYSPTATSACATISQAACPTTTEALAPSTRGRSAGAIAGITVGIIFLLSLATACFCCVRRRKLQQKRGANKHVSKRISLFNYIVDEKRNSHNDDVEETGGEEKQQQDAYANDGLVNTAQQQNGNVLCNSEEANEDNLYYCNSTDFHQSNNRNSLNTVTSTIRESTYMNHLPVATTFMEMSSMPQEFHKNMKRNDNIATSLYPPHINKHRSLNNNGFQQQQQQQQQSNWTTAVTPTSTVNFDISNNRSSLIIDNQNISAIHSRTPSHVTTNSNKSSFISNTNPYYDSFCVMKKTSYRPSLHDSSMFLVSPTMSRYPTTSTTSTASQNLSMIIQQQQARRVTAGHHQRQESDNLDPQVLNKMSLWDDHLMSANASTLTVGGTTVVIGGEIREGDAWSHEDRQSMMISK